MDKKDVVRYLSMLGKTLIAIAEIIEGETKK